MRSRTVVFILWFFLFFFFFSSRRRHTRLQGDWSSDVCSSDLKAHQSAAGGDQAYEGQFTTKTPRHRENLDQKGGSQIKCDIADRKHSFTMYCNSLCLSISVVNLFCHLTGAPLKRSLIGRVPRKCAEVQSRQALESPRGGREHGHLSSHRSPKPTRRYARP